MLFSVANFVFCKTQPFMNRHHPEKKRCEDNNKAAPARMQRLVRFAGIFREGIIFEGSLLKPLTLKKEENTG